MKFYSRGKLLISGEYLVLKGATVLTAPLKLSQSLKVTQREEKETLWWTSLEKDQKWFKARINTSFFDILETSDQHIAGYLVGILEAARQLNPKFLLERSGYELTSNLEFNRDWGFGSSSSLISNIAFWARIDPFELHKLVSQGSGYDVIAARQEQPVFFKLLESKYSVSIADFKPAFKNQIFFIYLGKKQNSTRSVNEFLKLKRSYRSEIRTITDLSFHLANSQTLEDFEFYIKEHEQIIASVLKIKSLKETLFRDLQGQVKLLGAWGGDFAMLTWHENKNNLERYLKSKKIETYFSFDEIIKS